MHGWKKYNTINNNEDMINLFNIGFTQKTAKEFFGKTRLIK